ncbi:MAG: hypothetical protein ACLQU3_14640 [Limisphaerales bacterium]|jgi:hypothetical protein
MNRLLVIAGWALFISVPGIVEAGTLFTTPVIYVTPQTLDFGRVAAKATATNTFVVENMGIGKLVGTVTVPAPFKVLSGGDYTLRENEAQIVTVVYTPSGAAADTQTVKFTGGGGAKARITGKLAGSASKQPSRP